MQNTDAHSGSIDGKSNELLEPTANSSLDVSAECVFTERFPLRFPKTRWAALDAEEQQRLGDAQLLLDALKPIHVRTLQALVADTKLEQEAMGPALGVLDDLGLIAWDEEVNDDDLLVKLIATPEEHLEVGFPDGEKRWIFIARPLVEPDIPKSRIN